MSVPYINILSYLGCVPKIIKFGGDLKKF